MGFEWDENKNEKNRIKHGISFEDAALIFDHAVAERPVDWSGPEKRIQAFGEVQGIVITVIYTWRGPFRRLISARKAGKNERENYFKIQKR
ncbi:MAG: BrnT family toxin [Nitrospinae bacterium]|nr:BrnT family toxin [Nitrospinota bacterium]